MAPQLHFMGSGVILRVISINIGVANVNGDVVASSCEAVFVGGLPGRSDLNWGILRSFDFSVHPTGTRKQTGEQQNQRSHGERQRYRSKVPLQSQKRS